MCDMRANKVLDFQLNFSRSPIVFSLMHCMVWLFSIQILLLPFFPSSNGCSARRFSLVLLDIYSLIFAASLVFFPCFIIFQRRMFLPSFVMLCCVEKKSNRCEERDNEDDQNGSVCPKHATLCCFFLRLIVSWRRNGDENVEIPAESKRFLGNLKFKSAFEEETMFLAYRSCMFTQAFKSLANHMTS